MKSTLNIHWKDWCWSWSSNTLATWFQELTHWKRPWCWERLKAGGEGDDRGPDGWMHHRLNGRENLCKFHEIMKDKEAWHAAVHGFAKSWTQLSDWTDETESRLVVAQGWGLREQGVTINEFLKNVLKFSSVQSLSCVRLFATPWTTACQASLSITSSQNLLKLMPTEWLMPSNHLILCYPLLLLPSIFPSSRVFSNESVLRIRWPKYWSFSFSISPFNEYLGLISFRTDWLDLLAV